jgi:hypothetical protein
VNVANDRIVINNDSIINVGDCIRAREGYVYIPDDNKVYKCFANLEKGQEAIEVMNAAREAGIQVPAYLSYNAVLQTGGRNLDVIVLQMKFISGRVFYASKPGGPAVFRNRIDEITNRSKLDRMKGILETAKAAGMTDPQGIITADDLLYFFDVHIGKGGTGGAVDPLIQAVENRLQALPVR